MAGYTRQSAADIVAGAAVVAAPLNAEFNQIQSAFNGTTGHVHDGSSGNGPKVSLTTSVSGTLPVANGGTNATTAAAARTSLFGVSTTTDNAIARYDSTAGALQNSGVTLSDVSTVGSDEVVSLAFSGHTFITLTEGATDNIDLLAGTDVTGNLTVSGTATVTGAFTSVGIDDNCTGETLQISDTSTQIGNGTTAHAIYHPSTQGALSIGGSGFVAGATSGAVANFYGGSHATLAGYLRFFSGTSETYRIIPTQHTWYISGTAEMDLTATALAPNSSDGLALGSTTKMWSDAFLASGAVINFNNGNYTLTHSAGALAASGALTVGGAFTSLGIDDNATTEILQISDTEIKLGTSTTPYVIYHPSTEAATGIGGSGVVGGATSGATAYFYGNAHATFPGYLRIFSDDKEVYRADDAQHTWYVAGTAEMTLDGSLLAPNTSDGLALGSATKMWSDLFLASGAVVNFDNSDVTVTHSSNMLNFEGGTEYRFTTGNVKTDSTLYVVAAGGTTLNGTDPFVAVTYSAQTGGITTSAAVTGATTPLGFYNPNGLVGSVSVSGSTTAYNTSSDERLKENFQSFDSGTLIDALNTYKFDWKIGGSSYGVKAQEAYQVYPDAITPGHGEVTDEDFVPWSADYSKFVPLLLAEIKSLRARVAALEGN